jgi:uncharacterized protein
MTFALAFFALFGHAFLWIGLGNRLHATALPRWIISLLSTVIFAFLAAGPILMLAWWWMGWASPAEKFGAAAMPGAGWMALGFYVAFCWLAGGATLGRWFWHNLHFRRPPKLLRVHRRRIADISPDRAALHAEERRHHLTAKLPGNQSLRLEVSERRFDVPRLPPALDGLKILHLSDFHFTGNVGKAYFREVVRVANELQPDLIALTGDFADSDDCIGWIPDTLGRLAAPCGVYYVLGNHDTFIDFGKLRETLNACGKIDLGGRWMQIAVRGQPIILAGNELPWIAPAAELSRCPPSSVQGGPVRIVLAHSPDQISWGRAYEVDLMLCGHTHGGQIRFPLIGALLMPSYYGVKFDCGLFDLPPTVLHVTRGVSGKQALRWFCAPEIVLLTLHTPSAKTC